MRLGVDFVDFWEPAETFLNPCVKMNVATKKWQTVSCTMTLPFVCLQLPPVPGISLAVSRLLFAVAAVTGKYSTVRKSGRSKGSGNIPTNCMSTSYALYRRVKNIRISMHEFLKPKGPAGRRCALWCTFP